MPDGKRNSIPSEGETEGENFYNEDLQNDASSVAKRHSTFTTLGFPNLSERLLKAMVANEIKKTLDAEDNKRLVAHHRPVLHSEAENDEMVVVGVVLNTKQVQNDEISKAVEMLRKNGVTCVCFTLKDTPNGTKKGESQILSEDVQKPVQDPPDSPTIADLSTTTAETKVSSPTVSTTSDYSAPSDTPNKDNLKDDVIDGCTSTTLLTPQDRLKEEPLSNSDIIASSVCEDSIPTENGDLEDAVVSTNGQKGATAAVRRKRRRKHMYPYVSRRKRKNKAKKAKLMPPQSEVADDIIETKERTNDEALSISPPPVQTNSLVEPQSESKPMPSPGKADPYEFEDSDLDAQITPEPFKVTLTPKAKRTPKSAKKKGSSVKAVKVKPQLSPGVKRGSGLSVKTNLFSKSRAFSPDITDHESGDQFTVQPRASSDVSKCSPTYSCVQPISTENDATKGNSNIREETSEVAPNDIKHDTLVFTNVGGQPKRFPLCDESNQGIKSCDDQEVLKCDKIEGSEKQSILVAQESCSVRKKQLPQPQIPLEQSNKELKKEPLMPELSDSLPDTPDSMQLRRSSFYSSITRNVRTNLEKYLDGRPQDLKAPKRSRKIKNGFLLHHGDNFPDDPEAPYRLHLATQVLLKLNKRRAKCKPKEDKGKSLLSYLKLQPKRVSRVGKHSKPASEESEPSTGNETVSVFSGEWTVPRKFICNICGQVENDFWDMVMHKGEIHPGIVVTHVELPDNPPEGFRGPPAPRGNATLPNAPPCSKCSATFSSYPDLHRHIFECAGNAALLEERETATKANRKRKGKRKRGFKRRISGLPKKSTSTGKAASASSPSKSGEITKRRNSEVYKCEFCAREFKTEGWLKNHVSLSHSLLVSIPLDKLSLPSRASICASRRFTSQLTKPGGKQPSRET